MSCNPIVQDVYRPLAVSGLLEGVLAGGEDNLQLPFLMSIVLHAVSCPWALGHCSVLSHKVLINEGRVLLPQILFSLPSIINRTFSDGAEPLDLTSSFAGRGLCFS